MGIEVHSMKQQLLEIQEVRLINTNSSKRPNGHYSQATLIGNTLYLSAQLPDTTYSGQSKDIEQQVERQTRSILDNITTIAQSAGATRNSIALVRFYSTDIKLWPIIDQAFSDYMGDHKPARAVICVAAIKHGYLVMAEAIAEIKSIAEE